MDQNAAILELLRQALAPKPPDYIGDLIKIGLPLLGTILGGIIGFVSASKAAALNRQAQIEVATTNQRTELRKELGARRAIRFEDILSKLDHFSQCLSSYVTMVENGIEAKATGQLTEAEKKKIEKSQHEFWSSFRELLSAESRLLALGHPEVQMELRTFGESAQVLYKKVHMGNSVLTVEEIINDMTALRRQRRDLIQHIGTAETLWWNG